MKFLNACVIVCLLALFLGCSAPDKTIYHDVTYDFDVAVDFTRIKTYNWVTMPATSRINEFNQIRIKEAVNAQFKAMYDAESHNEIWWAESRADLFFEMTPAQKDEVIEESVRRILEFFPPGP